ncbi:MAG: DUF3035 domain-containing protein [Proteobacteria bacterium]|nr:DUF3035 domain-containing protein [Pseudomonadota bacterium]
MTLSTRLVTISLVSSCILLHGCQSVKRTLGMERDAPDEFAVEPCSQPLDMPPDFFVLPVPRPGALPPQEIKAMQIKRDKLIGVGATKGTSSPGQKALLDLVGTEEGQGQVRSQIDEESRIESLNGNPLLKTLGIKQQKGDAVNPVEEAASLQEKGIARSSPVEAN